MDIDNVKYLDNNIDEEMTDTTNLKTDTTSVDVIKTPVIPSAQTDAERAFKEGLFNNSDTEKV